MRPATASEMADCRVLDLSVARNEARVAVADDLFAALQRAKRQQRQVTPLRRDQRHLLHSDVPRHIYQHCIWLLTRRPVVQSNDADLGHDFGYRVH
jgi:hypothetical protein